MNNQSGKGKCCQGNDVKLSCINKDCLKPALMCSNIQCQCFNAHETCGYILKLQVLDKIVQQKSKQCQPVINLLIAWYQSQIKKITIQLQNLKSILNKDKNIFCGQHFQFYKDFSSNKSVLITPQIALSSLNYLKQWEKTLELQKIQQIVRKQLEERQKQINKQLFKVKRIENHLKYKEISVDQQKWNVSFINPYLCGITSTKIRKTQHQYYSGYCINLLQFPIEKYLKNIQIYRFKIIKLQNTSVALGFCHLNQANENNLFMFLSNNIQLVIQLLVGINYILNANKMQLNKNILLSKMIRLLNYYIILSRIMQNLQILQKVRCVKQKQKEYKEIHFMPAQYQQILMIKSNFWE